MLKNSLIIVAILPGLRFVLGVLGATLTGIAYLIPSLPAMILIAIGVFVGVRLLKGTE